MLTYLIKVTDDLLAAAIVLGVIFAFLITRYGKWGKNIAYMGLAGGILAGAIRAIITNTRRIRNGWKIGFYGRIISLVLFAIVVIAVIVLNIKPIKNAIKGRLKAALDIAVPVLSALFIVSLGFTYLSEALAYPFQMDISDGGILSSDFLYKLGGYILGLIIVVLSTISADRIGRVASKKGYDGLVLAVFLAVLIVNAVFSFLRLSSTLTVRKYIDSVDLFLAASWSSNHSYLYTIIEFGIVLAEAIFLIVKSYTLKEEYNTLAERRRQKSIWRTGKRFSAVAVVCLILSVLCATWFVQLNTVIITEAPIEMAEVVKDDDGNDKYLFVPLSAVIDGHLHRFGYVTENGVTVRFIVVLKQEGTSNYGIGLDACEICGEAGYYEHQGQVVCKKCNVVMNKTTIGMKGGCNPIIIEYDIDETGITVPVSEMVKNEKRFK